MYAETMACSRNSTAINTNVLLAQLLLSLAIMSAGRIPICYERCLLQYAAMLHPQLEISPTIAKDNCVSTILPRRYLEQRMSINQQLESTIPFMNSTSCSQLILDPCACPSRPMHCFRNFIVKATNALFLQLQENHADSSGLDSSDISCVWVSPRHEKFDVAFVASLKVFDYVGELANPAHHRLAFCWIKSWSWQSWPIIFWHF